MGIRRYVYVSLEDIEQISVMPAYQLLKLVGVGWVGMGRGVIHRKSWEMDKHWTCVISIHLLFKYLD